MTEILFYHFDNDTKKEQPADGNCWHLALNTAWHAHFVMLKTLNVMLSYQLLTMSILETYFLYFPNFSHSKTEKDWKLLTLHAMSY